MRRLLKINFVEELPEEIISSDNAAYRPYDNTIWVRVPKPKPYLFAKVMCRIQMYKFLCHELGHYAGYKLGWKWLHKWLDGGKINYI